MLDDTRLRLTRLLEDGRPQTRRQDHDASVPCLGEEAQEPSNVSAEGHARAGSGRLGEQALDPVENEDVAVLVEGCSQTFEARQVAVAAGIEVLESTIDPGQGIVGVVRTPEEDALDVVSRFEPLDQWKRNPGLA